MAYCGPRGIPLSVFLSWDDDDQDAALAWQAHEAGRCPSCGTHPDEWTESLGGHRDAYHGELVICPGCQQLDATRSNHEKGAGKMPGAHVILRARKEEPWQP